MIINYCLSDDGCDGGVGDDGGDYDDDDDDADDDDDDDDKERLKLKLFEKLCKGKHRFHSWGLKFQVDIWRQVRANDGCTWSYMTT